MATFPIAYLRDDFADNTIAATWQTYPYAQGSATRSETAGQARITLPSSTAGTHENAYYSAATYDLTGDGAYINIDTMVSTSVAAYALWGFYFGDYQNQLRWIQQSGTIKAQTIVAGVVTDRYSASWSSSTYKYLRIRESGGNILFDSSSNGTSWTNRATVAAPFAITSLSAIIGAGCGNVASPGTFRIEDFNTISLATNWHWTQIEWPLLWRFRSITLATALAASAVGYIATSNDGTTWSYYSGPLGSGSGGYNQLTAQSTQAAAQAMAANIPLDGRWDLPNLVECRYIRLYHRSAVAATSYTLREYYARRLTQADDMEAESITALNIRAGSITADRLFVVQLSAITANIGGLVIDVGGYLWQGTGTPAAPTTGLKIWNSGGIGKISGYNTSVEQVTLDTDGKFKWAGGNNYLDAANGMSIGVLTQTSGLSGHQGVYGMRWVESGGAAVASIVAYNHTTGGGRVNISTSGGTGGQVQIQGTLGIFDAVLDQVRLSGSGGLTVSGNTTLSGGLNVGSASGAAVGEVRASQSLGGPRSGGSAVFAMDTTAVGLGISLANNATATPFGASNNFAGLILINEILTFGSVGLFLTGAGLISEIADPSTKYSTTAGTANSINVYMSSNVVTIENKTGSTINLNVCGFRNRTSS